MRTVMTKAARANLINTARRTFKTAVSRDDILFWYRELHKKLGAGTLGRIMMNFDTETRVERRAKDPRRRDIEFS